MLNRRGFLAAVPITAFAAGCTAPAGTSSGRQPGSILLGDGYEPESLHPLMGYAAEGAGKFYDGLLASNGQGQLKPALAAEAPQPDGGFRTWTVKLRDDVQFHDGSPFTAEDVAATYRAAIDPAYASTVSSQFSMLAEVQAVDKRTVRFDLRIPYSAWPSKLVMGIVPAATLQQAGPLEKSKLNTQPIGTGPYRLVEWRQGEQMRWEGNPKYWGGAPAINNVTVVFATDDNTRAQRLRAGEFDGTVLPPVLADQVGVDGYRTVHHRTVDHRSISLPNEHPVTGDRAVRLALNLAANRQGMIKALLGGHGVPAHTPIPPSMGEFHAPDSTFAFDRQQASKVLDEAGWTKGSDGTRRRGNRRASFSLMYFADDSLRKDFARSFASDAEAIGIDVQLAGVDRSAVESRLADEAIVLGGGNPLDPDAQTYQHLHSSVIGTGTYNNPAKYRNDKVDRALDQARESIDQDERAQHYHAMQRAYIADPGLIYLAFIDHSYVMRAETWTGYRSVVEPHTHGTTWGPWWNLEDWKPRT